MPASYVPPGFSLSLSLSSHSALTSHNLMFHKQHFTPASEKPFPITVTTTSTGKEVICLFLASLCPTSKTLSRRTEWVKRCNRALRCTVHSENTQGHHVERSTTQLLCTLKCNISNFKLILIYAYIQPQNTINKSVYSQYNRTDVVIFLPLEQFSYINTIMQSNKGGVSCHFALTLLRPRCQCPKYETGSDRLP